MVCRIQKTHSISKGQKIQFNYINSHLKNNILGKPDLTCIMHLKVNTMKKKKHKYLYCLPEDWWMSRHLFLVFQSTPFLAVEKRKSKNEPNHERYVWVWVWRLHLRLRFSVLFFFFFLHAFWDKFTVKNTVYILYINSSGNIWLVKQFSTNQCTLYTVYGPTNFDFQQLFH